MKQANDVKNVLRNRQKNYMRMRVISQYKGQWGKQQLYKSYINKNYSQTIIMIIGQA